MLARSAQVGMKGKLSTGVERAFELAVIRTDWTGCGGKFVI